jgi:ribosomal protein L37AE/L43A
MSFNNNNKQFLLNQIMWLGMSLGISIAVSLLLPFPISLVTTIGVFILINFYMRKRMMQRTGMGGGRVGMFGSMSSSSSSPSSSSMYADNSLKYYCMSCGTQHKQVECPKCGSKMKKVGL